MEQKKIEYIGVGVVFFLLLVSVLTPCSQIQVSKTQVSTGDRSELNSSWIWDLTDSPIVIDDTDPTCNWEKTAAENPWCSGSGVLGDPYVISSVRIVGDGTYKCISIYNSRAYFVIHDSLIYNEKVALHNTGMYFANVTNGQLQYNYFFSDGNGIGVEFYQCSEMVSYMNEFFNHRFGIYLFKTNNSQLYWNIVADNYEGICLTASNDNDIFYNRVESNSYQGLNVNQESNHNIMRFNNFSHNTNFALLLYYESNYNTVQDNLFELNKYDVGNGLSCKGNIFSNNGDCAYYNYDDISSSEDDGRKKDDDEEKESKNVQFEFPSVDIAPLMFLVVLIVSAVIVVFSYLHFRTPKNKVKYRPQVKGWINRRVSSAPVKHSSGRDKHYFTLEGDQIPKGLLNFIYQKNRSNGRIKISNLPAELRKRGVDHCDFEISKRGVILKCYSS